MTPAVRLLPGEVELMSRYSCPGRKPGSASVAATGHCSGVTQEKTMSSARAAAQAQRRAVAPTDSTRAYSGGAVPASSSRRS